MMHSFYSKILEQSDNMAISYPQSPSPLVVDMEHIQILKHIWSQVNIKTLGRDIVNNLLKSLNISEISPWQRQVIREDYQVLEMIHFLEFTVQLLQDLHRPKVHTLHNQMMVQICKINSRIFKIGTSEYSKLGESLTFAILEQLNRENYSTESECIWNRFYSNLAQLMINHSLEPRIDFIRISMPSKRSSLDVNSRAYLRSNSNISNVTELSRLSLIAGDDNSSEGSVTSDTTTKELILSGESCSTLHEFSEEFVPDIIGKDFDQHSEYPVNSNLSIRRTNTNMTDAYDDGTDNFNNSIDETQSIFSNVIDESQQDEEEEDDSFDYLNSFAEDVTKSKKNKKKSQKESKKANNNNLTDLSVKRSQTNQLVKTDTRRSLMKMNSFIGDNRSETRTLRHYSSTQSMQPLSVSSKELPSISTTAKTGRRRLSMNLMRQSIDLRRIPSTQSMISEDQGSIISKSQPNKECVIA
ncbi:hypothetical protein CLIB1423_05S06326 [[Candida] railenensis]|uniref:Uncharacterized protein n=1 Tax=[Candida] railenensis TaxID=45579 RepID=A0A9P0VY22_9ASCO|nr:hypothetical protein CLIB1423_05S06326 [[Candida] railenensis]